jgi:hypothetical protein
MANVEKRYIRIEDWKGNIYYPETSSGSTVPTVMVGAEDASTEVAEGAVTYSEGVLVTDTTANNGQALLLNASATNKTLFQTNFDHVPFGNVYVQFRIKLSSVYGGEILKVNTYFVDNSDSSTLDVQLQSTTLTGTALVNNANEYNVYSMVLPFKGNYTGSVSFKVELIVMGGTGVTVHFDYILGGADSDAKDTLMAELKKLHIDTPNNRYEERDLGTWSSVSDVDAFMKAYNHDNNYEGLSLGNYVTILDGTYNAQWMIAGFDIFTTEDGNYTADSHKGITWIPKTILTTGRMNPTNTTDGCYMGSEMYQTTLPAIAEKLKVVLGDHLLYRWVGVSTGTFESNNTAPARAYLTCPTEIELAGVMICGKRRDCGENVSQLPVFKYTKWAQGYSFWTRTPTSTTTWAVDHAGNGVLDDVLASQIDNIRPIMFLKP